MTPRNVWIFRRWRETLLALLPLVLGVLWTIVLPVILRGMLRRSEWFAQVLPISS